MRRMSFALTRDQLLDGSKTVTRRVGWRTLKAGDQVRAVSRVQGMQKGESATVYGVCDILDVRREPLDAILAEFGGVAREGFPDMTSLEFVCFFADKMRCTTTTEITRIEFHFTPTRGVQ